MVKLWVFQFATDSRWVRWLLGQQQFELSYRTPQNLEVQNYHLKL